MNIELRDALDAVEQNVPPGDAVVSDYVNSAAVVAQTRRPVLLLPKYETLRTRERIFEFTMAFFHESPDSLGALMRRYGARYLLVNTWAMRFLMAYVAGIPDNHRVFAPGTAAAAFLSSDAGVLANVPGFQLLYRSPARNRIDMFRLYRAD